MHQLWTPWRMNYLKSSSPVNMECVFCHKVRGEDDAKEHVLYRGANVFVTLNLYPYNNGHLMIIPYQHTSDLTDLDEAVVAEIMQVTQISIHVLREAFSPQGFNIGTNMGAAAGAGIADHIHQHVVPRWGGDTNFLSTIGETRTIPEWIDQTYERLLPLFEKQAADRK
jgi:ATP adenylyltransferase